MGQDMELDLDLNDQSSVGLSPNTVLPSYKYGLNVKKKYKKGRPTGKDDLLTLKEDFSEIKFARFCSSSCKNILSKPHGPDGNIEMRRGSMYQSSGELKNMHKMGTIGGRKKIEISLSSDTSFSCSIVDSLCSSDDEDLQQKSSVISQDSNLSLPSVSRSCACMEANSPDGFIEICINSYVRDNYSATVGRDTVPTLQKSLSAKVSGALIDGNPTLGKDTVHTLQKSLSAKVEVSHMLSPSGSDCSSRASPNVQYSPIRKRFNPFTKSKSLRSPVSHMLKISEVKSTGIANITRSRTYQKSLLNDFSNTVKHSDIISEFINRDIQHSGIACSPVHLHGNLKLENKHGVLFFEFKVKCPEEVFVAKTWSVDSASNWVYTFHSSDRRKSNATGLGSHDSDKDSSLVAQMLVSCNLCSELNDGVFDNSIVTEFVLYDLAPSRQSVSRQKASTCDQDAPKSVKASHVGLGQETFKLDEEHLSIKNKLQHKLACGNVDLDYTNSYPWLFSELHPNLEIAAIVLQIPCHKRESLKYKRGKRLSAKAYPNLFDLSVIDQSRKSLHDHKIQEQVKVVIPAGSHGLPNAESQGPSSLLDRWRLGGGCDCGGWDMACPIILLGNPGIQFAEDHSLVGNHQPLELFVQGAKESTPTFSMREVEAGQYAVDFHAKLSTLQAFSICVAILRGSSAFSGTGPEKKQQSSECNSLKMLMEEEVEFLIESVTREEKKPPKTQKGVPRSYVLNPPISPIARV